MAELNTTSIEGSLTVSETASIGGDLTVNGEMHGASIESSGILKGASLNITGASSVNTLTASGTSNLNALNCKNTAITGNLSVSGSLTCANLLKAIYPVGAIYESTSSTNPETLFGGTWTLRYSGPKRIFIGSSVLDWGTSNASSLPDWTMVTGAYSYGLINGVFQSVTIPSGYHREYKMTFLGSTGNNNQIIMALNNIQTNAVGTWSGATFRQIGATPFFKESDVTLETTYGYSTAGINLKYKLQGVTGRWQWWDATIHGFLTSDKTYYEWERTA